MEGTRAMKGASGSTRSLGSHKTWRMDGSREMAIALFQRERGQRGEALTDSSSTARLSMGPTAPTIDRPRGSEDWVRMAIALASLLHIVRCRKRTGALTRRRHSEVASCMRRCLGWQRIRPGSGGREGKSVRMQAILDTQTSGPTADRP